ncbi:DUF1622 domain-containing protein [Actinomycetota bacterium]|jgi:uncharacterized membrane protein
MGIPSYNARVILVFATENGVTIGGFELARDISEFIEVLAMAVIAIGVVASIGAGFVQWYRHGAEAGFEAFKRLIARGLLIGLDLLIAADVIKTVTLEGTLESALVLGLLVLIRTFLSWTLVLEVEGTWPWRRVPRTDDE